MTQDELEEFTRLKQSIVAAKKRVDDAIAAVDRITDEIHEMQKALLIIDALPLNPPRAEEVLAWRLPSGPMA